MLSGLGEKDGDDMSTVERKRIQLYMHDAGDVVVELAVCKVHIMTWVRMVA